LLTPVSFIKRLIDFTNAKLYVVHVMNPAEIVSEDSKNNKRLLTESLADIEPTYYEPEFRKIITAIDNFTAEENINMLVVMPGRQGIWQQIFQERHTKGLVYLNNVPILSLYREGHFI